MKRRCTQEQLNKIKELYFRGKSSGEIAKIMEISPQTMWRISKELGIIFPKGKKSKITKEQLDKIKELSIKNIPASQIAKIIGITERIILNVYKKNNIVAPGNKLLDLTDEQNNHIIDLFNKGEGTRSIAKILGITRHAVVKAFKILQLNNSGRSVKKTAYLAVEKCCKICNLTKYISQFRKRIKKNRISYETYCLDCEKKYNKKLCSKRYLNNKEKYIEYKKNNLNKIKQYHKQYIKKYRKNKMNTDVTFKMRSIISTAIYIGLKKNCANKISSCWNFLGYSPLKLKEHLEKQFEPWMTWKNYGMYLKDKWNDNDPLTWTWQIDHIIPQSKLPYTSMQDENFKKCWELNNLRPYSAKQNLLDGVNRIRHKC